MRTLNKDTRNFEASTANRKQWAFPQDCISTFRRVSSSSPAFLAPILFRSCALGTLFDNFEHAQRRTLRGKKGEKWKRQVSQENNVLFRWNVWEIRFLGYVIEIKSMKLRNFVVLIAITLILQISKIKREIVQLKSNGLSIATFSISISLQSRFMLERRLTFSLPPTSRLQFVKNDVLQLHQLPAQIDAERRLFKETSYCKRRYFKILRISNIIRFYKFLIFDFPRSIAVNYS